MRKTLVPVVGLILSLALVLAACAGQAQPVNLTVFGAASLKAALEDMKPKYEASHEGVTLNLSTAASSTLKTQIVETGGGADLFLSADEANAQGVVDAGLNDGAASPFATNILTIVVPEGNPANITSPADLGRAGVKVVAARDDVPITRYAKQLVDNLAAQPDFPADFASAYQANVVTQEESVGAVTSKIKLGEGDAAIVYVTDAETAGLPTIDVPVVANVIATYAGVVVKSPSNAPAAHTLFDWIKGPDGQAILAEFGFRPVP